VRDQFGERNIFVKDADFLCAPAVRGTAQPTPIVTATETPVPSFTDAPSPTATPTPSATLTETPTVTPTETPVPSPTATPPGCGNVGDTCGGGCLNQGESCFFIGTACDCAPILAGCAVQPDTSGIDGPIGICSGLCHGINEQCLPAADRTVGPGCECRGPE